MISLDALFAISLSVVVIVGMLAVVQERENFVDEFSKLSEAKMAARVLASIINKAYSSGEGFFAEVDLNIARYNVNISENRVSVSFPDPFFSTHPARTYSVETFAERIALCRNATCNECISMQKSLRVVNNGTHVVVCIR